MTGNIKTFAAYLTISLAVFGAASAMAANCDGGQDRDQSGNGTDVYVSRGKIVGGGDDGSVDADVGEFDMVARPKTIIPGAGMAQGADAMDTRPGANMASGSFGPSSFGPADVANSVHRGSNNGGLELQSSAFGQVSRGRIKSWTRMADTNAAPDGVYNQFGFGATAAAANSAYPSEHSLHANLPNRIDADAYNHQFAKGSYSVSGYDRSYGGSGTFENGYTPFLYYSPLYDRPHSINYGSNFNDAAFGSGALEYLSLTTVVVQPAVYEYSRPLTTLVAARQPAVADQMGTGFDAARDAFKAGDYSWVLELTDQAIRRRPIDASLHELRGLVLFALQRYEDADEPLHVALAVGSRWNWRTLVGLYPKVSLYTEQLRALENYCNANPRSASARFVLAYLYKTQGNTDVTVDQLHAVVALRPQDAVAARLFLQLDKNRPHIDEHPPGIEDAVYWSVTRLPR